MIAPAYAGVFAGSLGESGTIDFVVAPPTPPATESSLTGSLLIESTNGPITLSGTVDHSGSYARFSGLVPGQAGTLDCYGSFFAGKFGGACTGDDFYHRYFSSAALGTEPFLSLLRHRLGSHAAKHRLESVQLRPRR